MHTPHQTTLGSDIHTLLPCAASAATAVFFTYTNMAPTQGFFYLGIMVIGITAFYATMYFPMWGGMFCAAKPGVTEEDYYISGGAGGTAGRGMWLFVWQHLSVQDRMCVGGLC